MVSLNDNVFRYRTFRIRSTITSTAEAELMAIYKTQRQIRSLENMLHAMNLPTKIPIIFNDNKAAIQAIVNNKDLKQLAHVHVEILRLRERAQHNDFSLHYVDTRENVADYLTKALASNKFRYFTAYCVSKPASQATESTSKTAIMTDTRTNEFDSEGETLRSAQESLNLIIQCRDSNHQHKPPKKEGELQQEEDDLQIPARLVANRGRPTSVSSALGETKRRPTLKVRRRHNRTNGLCANDQIVQQLVNK